MMKAAMTIDEFCSDYSIPRRTLYHLWSKGDGPPRCQLSERRILIRREAAEKWLREREAAT